MICWILVAVDKKNDFKKRLFSLSAFVSCVDISTSTANLYTRWHILYAQFINSLSQIKAGKVFKVAVQFYFFFEAFHLSYHRQHAGQVAL